MKFLKSISLFCFILFIIYVSVSFFYSNTEKTGPQAAKRSRIEQAKELNTQDLTVSTKQNVTTCDTVYEVEAYVGDYYSHFIEPIPFAFTGLTMEQLEKEIKRYDISPSFEDKQKGLISIELLSFHPEKISVKKIFAPQEEKVFYYLKAVNHELVVYRSDMEEPYMPTDLTLDLLPENVQQEIIATKCFNDIRDVYAFLESYTS